MARQQRGGIAKETAQISPATDAATLSDMSQLLSRALRPVQPNPAFVASLHNEIVDAARHVEASGRSRRTAIIAAAAVGSLISVASVAGAVAYLVNRRRAQVQPARA
jgi:hypothetical protein